MDDGSVSSKGLKLATNSFSYSECLFLTVVLLENFNIKATVQSAGVPNQYVIYI
jgi:LAGLIDADG DNA endonuclease family